MNNNTFWVRIVINVDPYILSEKMRVCNVFTTELSKNNFDLNLSFKILNLLTVFTRLKVHLDNVNYFP